MNSEVEDGLAELMNLRGPSSEAREMIDVKMSVLTKDFYRRVVIETIKGR